jgi:hypothetical protein
VSTSASTKVVRIVTKLSELNNITPPQSTLNNPPAIHLSCAFPQVSSGVRLRASAAFARRLSATSSFTDYRDKR